VNIEPLHVGITCLSFRPATNIPTRLPILSSIST